MIVKFLGNKVLKSWATKDGIDETSMAQLDNVSKLPILAGPIISMPDVHGGYGVPIGTAVPIDPHYIIPYAIGSDIGCLDKDTEYLTTNGWKKMSNYSQGTLILQYDKYNDTASFIKPINYIKQECNEFFHFKNGKGLDQMVCSEHKMLIWKGYRSTNYVLQDYNPTDLIKVSNKLGNGYYSVKAAFNIENNEGINLSDDEIRLDIMISADGCIRRTINGKSYIELHLKKSRKINRAQYLLNKNDIEYTISTGNYNTTYIYFNINRPVTKDLSKYWGATRKQLKIIMEECLLWDGHEGYRSFYSTTNKINADIIQFAFTSNNIRAGISEVHYENKKWSTIYVVTPTKNNKINITNSISVVKSEDGYKYCFTVPSGYFVARRNGRIFITGNCGMCAYITDFKVTDELMNKRTEIMDMIKDKVPVGYNSHKEPKQFHPFYGNKEIWNNYETEKSHWVHDFADEIEHSKYQLGTMGGNNHFIELQKDSDNNLVIMIHSGSRKLGNSICRYFHNIAKELCDTWKSNIPTPELSFLPIYVNEGMNYFIMMRLAIAFAKANRLEMLKVVMNILESMFDIQFDIMNYIDCIHNFASLETIDGKLYMMHRKGAVKVTPGQRVIIPGNFETGSFIVEGLNTRTSLNSCSHGAGRTMGRKEAVIRHDKEEIMKRLNGNDNIINKPNMDNIAEESKESYKDINDVIFAQRDLIKPVVKTTPLCTIKG